MALDMRAGIKEEGEDQKDHLADQEIVLQHLVDNDYKVLDAIELRQRDLLAALQAVQNNVGDHLDNQQERLLRAVAENGASAVRNGSSDAPDEWEIMPWEVEFGTVLGRGGFGEVSRGTWLGHVDVALKRLRFRLNNDDLQRDFLKEVRAWYPLRHPHILSLLGASVRVDRPFMVSPFMAGGHALAFLEGN
ncbi:Mitogen-activated protein kinase kinase kinase mlk-1, partial [Cladochytrium tenue]